MAQSGQWKDQAAGGLFLPGRKLRAGCAKAHRGPVGGAGDVSSPPSIYLEDRTMEIPPGRRAQRTEKLTVCLTRGHVFKLDLEIFTLSPRLLRKDVNAFEISGLLGAALSAVILEAVSQPGTQWEA